VGLGALVDGVHNDIAVGGFPRSDQVDRLSVEVIEEGAESRRGALALDLLELTVRTGDHQIGAQRGVALGSRHLDSDRVRHIVPRSGQGTDGAARELEQGFAEFVAALVPVSSGGENAGYRLDSAEHPKHKVENVSSEVSKRADAGLASIGHPSPIGVEPAAERAAVAVARPDAGDSAEKSLVNLLLQGAEVRAASAEVTGLENNLVLFEQLEDRLRLLGTEAHRLLDEHGLAEWGKLLNEIQVVDGLAADDERIDARVGGKFVKRLDAAAKLLGVLLSTRRIVVPNTGAAKTALEDIVGKTGSVNMARTEPGELGWHESNCSRCWLRLAFGFAFVDRFQRKWLPPRQVRNGAL